MIEHRNALKTHCPRAHEYDGVNSQGRRICRTCMRAADARRREKREPYRVQLMQLDEGCCIACERVQWLYAPLDKLLVQLCGRCCQKLWGGL